MLATEIRDNWAGSPSGYASSIKSLVRDGYEAWTVKSNNEYGVALPIKETITVSERFSGAHLYTETIILNNEQTRYALLLTAKSTVIEVPFSSLCAELVYPGINGEFRDEVLSSPVSWWAQWKELLGNKNVDERVYDILGELITLKYLASRGENAEWNGPESATYDIDCDGKFYEVKSTTLRGRREITLSSLFQLDPPADMELFLVLCQFEASQSGVSINKMVTDLEMLGYSSAALNEKLSKLGYEKGKSARNRCYILHAVIEYKVDENFPAIRGSSFIGGALPTGVQSITYTVSLDGVNGRYLITGQASNENDL